ncbi:ABC transporter substrate-binding protein [soil metagenome]
MSRLDDLITDLTSSRISRRRFMQSAAALGLSAPALHLLNTSHILAQDAGKITWISPRGLLEVFDDYPYWVAKQYGWFGDIEAVIEPGPGAGAETLVAEGQGDMAFPSPGVFSISLEQEVPIVSVFQMGAYDVFDFAFRKGEATDDLTTLEGKTIIIGNESWTSIVNPMLAAQGADHTSVEYAVGSFTTWLPLLQQGDGDAALSWEGKRAEATAAGLDFDYWLGLEHSDFPANSFVIRKSDFDDPSTHQLYTDYLRGWAMGLEFGHHNPRAAAQITYNAEQIADGIQTSFPPETVPDAIASLWQLANVFRGDWPTRNGGQWGWHAPEAWDLWFETIRDIDQLTKEFATGDVIKNDFVEGANDFDHEMVAQAAADFELDELFSSVPEPEGAGSDGAYPTPA